jgi:dTDP-4-amino-4,6-dideoxygalactose transaminase
MIPLVNLTRQYHTISAEIVTAIDEVMATSSFIQGKTVGAFADTFAACPCSAV